MEVEWRAAAREEFPSEDVEEQVVFASFLECGFNLPAGDFFHGLLYYYRLELVHLVPNSITVVSTFIHFFEAYLGILPHFLLWRYFFCVKSTGKSSGLVGAVMFNLRSGLKAEWINTNLPDNTTGWRSEWFYIADRIPGLPRCMGHKPVKISEWNLGLPTRDLEDLKGVLELVSDLKKQGVTGAAVARSFCRRMIQPIKDRVHPAYEYCGQSDPTREVNRKVSKEEMAARFSHMYSGKVKVKKCLKAHLLKRPADPIINGASLPKTLIDGGNSLNIIFTETLCKMEFDFTKMTACDEPFYGVVPGKTAYPIGCVCLPVTFGTENFRTEYLTLEVADFRSSYHTIFGRTMFAKFMAIPHHTYLIMKMPAPNRILSVLGDIMVSYNCKSATIELSKDSTIKAATTVMVAQAAKIDQTTLQVSEQKRTSTTLDPSPTVKKVCLGLPEASKEVVIGADLNPK
jgi:hypothetical protein